MSGCPGKKELRLGRRRQAPSRNWPWTTSLLLQMSSLMVQGLINPQTSLVITTLVLAQTYTLLGALSGLPVRH